MREEQCLCTSPRPLYTKILQRIVFDITWATMSHYLSTDREPLNGGWSGCLNYPRSGVSSPQNGWLSWVTPHAGAALSLPAITILKDPPLSALHNHKGSRGVTWLHTFAPGPAPPMDRRYGVGSTNQRPVWVQSSQSGIVTVHRGSNNKSLCQVGAANGDEVETYSLNVVDDKISTNDKNHIVNTQNI